MHDKLEHLTTLAHRMDRAFRVPILGMRVGWDSVLGVIPGVGDVVTLIPAGYIILQARQMGAPPKLLARMVANVGIDTAIGLVPFVGDVFDIAWKANSRNVLLLHRHLAQTVPEGA
ncbi:DUF4112 domain-containing protein [Sulfitobacter sabulilitoris]|uniref:DUF4112 domain-containing protein n=1 Tax=Sulfitobacter sabulilitoris TaxID=2562655 RepID=UPI001FEC1EA0|nr:DUF4112 domain-containing protein [Sulfitobacter sabulilitoris]